MLPNVQLALRPGMIELGWGHPSMGLLPTAAVAEAAAHALGRHGREALSYGAEQGPGCLIAALCRWLGQREGPAPQAAQVLITGGASQALDLLCTLLTRHGDVVLVESPTYHLALRILRDHGLVLVPVPGDAQGLSPDALAEVLEALRSRGQRPRFLYLVPTFGNPTGVTLSLDRRARLVSLAQQADLTIIEDDVYRELWYDAPPPPALFTLAPDGPIVRLGSFSKILGPGLRLGWLQASPGIVQRCVRSGLLDSGGGINHFTAHVAAALLEMGLLDGHLELLRRTYRQQRDALLDALARFLPADCRWHAPGGGFFVWLALPAGRDSARLLPIAEEAGVSYVPGVRFFAGQGGASYARLAFSLLAPQELEEGARRLGRVLNGT